MPTKPLSALLDPAMADPVRRRRINAYMRLMDKPVTLRELRKSRQLTQGTIAVRLKRSQVNVSRIEREGDPRISTVASFVEAMGGKLAIVAEFEDQETPLLLKF